MEGDRSVYDTSILGTPTSVRDISSDCPIKGKAIHADLATWYDLERVSFSGKKKVFQISEILKKLGR